MKALSFGVATAAMAAAVGMALVAGSVAWAEPQTKPDEARPTRAAPPAAARPSAPAGAQGGQRPDLGGGRGYGGYGGRSAGGGSPPVPARPNFGPGAFQGSAQGAAQGSYRGTYSGGRTVDGSDPRSFGGRRFGAPDGRGFAGGTPNAAPGPSPGATAPAVSGGRGFDARGAQGFRGGAAGQSGQDGRDPRFGSARGGFDGRQYGARGFGAQGFTGRGGFGRGDVYGRVGGRSFAYNGAHHDAFRVARYDFPRGYGYRRYDRGYRLPWVFLSPSYFIDDYAGFYLSAPPADVYRWVRYGPDALLVDTRTGEVVDAAYGVFYDGANYGERASAYGNPYDDGDYGPYDDADDRGGSYDPRGAYGDDPYAR